MKHSKKRTERVIMRQQETVWRQLRSAMPNILWEKIARNTIDTQIEQIRIGRPRSMKLSFRTL